MKIKISLILIFFLSIFYTQNVHSQNNFFDSLIQPLDTIKIDTLKVKFLNKKGSQIMYDNPETAKEILKLAIDLSKKNDYYKGEGIANIYLGSIYSNLSDFEKAIESHNNGYSASLKAEFSAGCSENIYSIGLVYDMQGEFKTALQFYDSAYQYSWNLKDSINSSRYLVGIGNIFIRRGLYGKALETYKTAQSIMEDIGYDHGVAICIFNIGNIYLDQNKFEKAREYYIKGKQEYEKIGDFFGETVAENNIGAVYDAMGKRDVSLKIYLSLIQNYKTLNDEQGLSHIYANIGSCYSELNNPDSALLYLDKALVIQNKIGNKEELLLIYNKLGYTYKNIGDYTKAVIYSKRSLKLSEEIQSLSRMKEAYLNLSETYEKAGVYKKSLYNYKQYKKIHDSIFNEENRKKIVQTELKFEYEKKEKIIELEQKRKDDLYKAELKQKNNVILFAIGGIILLIILAILILRTSRIRKKLNTELTNRNIRINQQKDEIISQNDEILSQRNQLQKSNENIQASINYASRIQNAVLPDLTKLNKNFSNFVYFKPRDIVSGDFYWYKDTEEHLIITAADCTGHGVPGAFVSMLGISFLNEITLKKEESNPAEILNELRLKMKTALKQSSYNVEQKDGIDMSLCTINKDTKILQYSGANNPIYIIRNNELIILKATRNPVGIYFKELPFDKKTVQLKSGDNIYMFSDGYIDQFGGPKQKKFKTHKFINLLLTISEYEMTKQKNIISEIFLKWKGDLKQIDDVLVLGLKID